MKMNKLLLRARTWMSIKKYVVEGWDEVGDGRELQEGGDMYACGWFLLMYGRNQHNTVENYPSVKNKLYIYIYCWGKAKFKNYIENKDANLSVVLENRLKDTFGEERWYPNWEGHEDDFWIMAIFCFFYLSSNSQGTF